MKSTLKFLAIIMAGLLLTSLAHAQMGMGMHPPSIAGVFNPVVGSGATYEIATKNGTKMSIDIAVVDKESGGYWIEIGMLVPQMNGSSYMKELVVRQGDDLVVQRVIMQMPGRPPVDLSSMPHAMQSQQSKADVRANAQNLGTESVTTPAGTFSCQHWRDAKSGDDYWISDKVTPWQLVKMTGADKENLVLTKVITGAKTHITGTPVSMQDMMKGMGMKGPGQ
jgi:hypothetical protein